MDLFDAAEGGHEPLASRMRPRTLDDLVGQEGIVGPGRLLRRAIQADQLSSLIFYGPPGTGKTTIARIIANTTKSQFISLNAVLGGVKLVREAIEQAQEARKFHNRKTILFVDEVHRWNKAQQDALLPWVENGTVILIGATTENPYFEVNSALVSRSRVFQLKLLTAEHLKEVVKRALSDRLRGYGEFLVEFGEGALEHLVQVADGDARTLLNALQLAVETSVESFPPPKGEMISISLEAAEESIQRRAVLYDKEGDYHFDTISAFIKSIRGSDPDAVLYWLALMFKAGEDPRFILRRILISATEDIGLADPQALVVANSAAQAFDRMGLPEGIFPITQAALYLATAPKSNSNLAIFDAMKAVEEEGQGDVPMHLKDASRDGKDFGHGRDYKYPHAYREHWIAQQYLPETLKGRIFYTPGSIGYEKGIQDEVLRRREVQLAAVLEARHDEILSSSPGGERKTEWMNRSLGGDTRNGEKLREALFEPLEINRHGRVLILKEESGLLLFEAYRRTPEGSVCASVPRESTRQMLEHLCQSIPQPERPLLLSGGLNHSGFMDQVSDFLGQSDVILGQFSSFSQEEAEWLPEILEKLLESGGSFSLSFTLPGAGTRLSDFLLKDEAERLRSCEDLLYGKFQDLICESIERLKKLADEVTSRELAFSGKRVISRDQLDRWLVSDEKKSNLGGYLMDKFPQSVENIREGLENILSRDTVFWERKSLHVYGKIK